MHGKENVEVEVEHSVRPACTSEEEVACVIRVMPVVVAFGKSGRPWQDHLPHRNATNILPAHAENTRNRTSGLLFTSPTAN